MRKFLISLLFFALILSEIYTASSTPVVKIIDIVEVSFGNNSSNSASIELVASNLTDRNLPYWNSVLRKSKENNELKLGIRDFSSLSLRPPNNCDGNTSIRYIEAAKSLLQPRYPDIDFNNRYLVVLIPRINCVWEAVSSVNQSGKWSGGMILNGTDKEFVISHELGHALGLGHSNLLACNLGKRDGDWLNDCRGIEYGGAVDVMGNVEVRTSLSTYHLWRMGLLENQDVKEVWNSQEVLLSSVGEKQGFRSIFLRDKDASYWIEYRRESFNGLNKPGLVIYRIDSPPPGAIVSPNPDYIDGVQLTDGVSTDMWLINLDDYQYLSGRASGSMTLPSGKSFVTKSGVAKIEFESADLERVKVKITRSPDSVSPPTPEIENPNSWFSPDAAILKSGITFEDKDSIITFYEIEAAGGIRKVESYLSNSQPSPKYPLTPPRTVLGKDLPEGEYDLRVRAVDAWGNRSAWSNNVKVSIDRGYPEFQKEAFVSGVLGLNARVNFLVSDKGSGICLSRIYNGTGFSIARSTIPTPDSLAMPLNKLKGTFESFDCKGNGLRADIEATVSKVSVSKMRKLGKWQISTDSLGNQVGVCKGKCSASFTVRGAYTLFAGNSTGDVLINNKKVSKFFSGDSEKERVVYSANLGSKSATARISGNDLKIFDAYMLKAVFGQTSQIRRSAPYLDPTLGESSQSELRDLGFSFNDFEESWIIQPLAKGTTLESPTLDLCYENYDSDKKRMSRRQLQVFQNGSPYLFLSTEVVKYESAGAAELARKELIQRLDDCIKLGGFKTTSGDLETYEFLSLDSEGSKYKEVDNGLLMHVKIGAGSNARWLLAYYQFKSSYFSGLYVVKPSQSPFSSSELSEWEAVRKVISARLLQK